MAIEPAKAQLSCQNAVERVLQDIERLGTSANSSVNFSWIDTGGEYLKGRYFDLGNKRRKDMITFALNNEPDSKEQKISLNILGYSPVLLESYIKRVFASCGGTGYVLFEMESTDYVVGSVMTDSGTLAFPCCHEDPRHISNNITRIEQDYQYGVYCALVPESYVSGL